MDVIVVSDKRGRTWRPGLEPGHGEGGLPVVLPNDLACVLCGKVGYWTHGDGAGVPPTPVEQLAEVVDTAGSATPPLSRAPQGTPQIAPFFFKKKKITNFSATLNKKNLF